MLVIKKILMCLEIGISKWSIIIVELVEWRWSVGRIVIEEEGGKKLG